MPWRHPERVLVRSAGLSHLPLRVLVLQQQRLTLQLLAEGCSQARATLGSPRPLRRMASRATAPVLQHLLLWLLRLVAGAGCLSQGPGQRPGCAWHAANAAASVQRRQWGRHLPQHLKAAKRGARALPAAALQMFDVKFAGRTTSRMC